MWTDKDIDKSIPCIEVEREALSYTPLWAHSLRKFKRNGVPGMGRPRDVINKPILNIAIPELFSLHGKYTLKSEHKKNSYLKLKIEISKLKEHILLMIFVFFSMIRKILNGEKYKIVWIEIVHVCTNLLLLVVLFLWCESKPSVV